ncbi:uncharacterized protein PFL1_02802 [Pseudozyma flocculosa PF-1]|uniref:Sodium/calcium exchanger membrane region domain-containing protein n=2 Tax=Pseudozyma flocculosa TaxID=84751 RepID=A0A5C3F1H0_9BASI|nr:uncharacterized protein PFL1_02802 [Pseudozyma flocculosa PF-1]EPQ29583.1 hypothetical protein PFL1_02802 [Pseudozyma flocculosa PF-1]SPO38132.1 uncharacterized protein PSFLO_03609 [Pseudozyma flocculosa]
MARGSAISGARRADAWLVFAILIVIQIVCFRGSARLRDTTPTSQTEPRHAATFQQTPLWKRDASLAAPQQPRTYATQQLHLSQNHATSSQPQHGHHAHDDDDKDPPAQTECHPIPISSPPSEICAHVIQHCEPSGHIDYLRFYYCAGAAQTDGGDHHDHPPDGEPHHRPKWRPGLAALRVMCLVIILCWMLFLFSWVGVVASDFFCPNLSTIASRLGLNESTAGVTFLAFGNGSPDVFSTFGAMKTGSGSLAIGELVGAASFIVSVISGSMMLIAPFRVKPWPFCRDVGFFTVAVALILIFLFDGKLRISECITLICLYLVYAATVILGGWWQERRRQKRLMLAAARTEYDSSIGDASSLRSSIHSGQHRDVERSQLLSVPGGLGGSPRSGLSPSEYEPDFDPFDAWAGERSQEAPTATATGEQRLDGWVTPDRLHGSGTLTPGGLTPGAAMSRGNSRSQPSNRPGLVPRHSLLSAIEFRDVVHSLRQDATADRSMEIFQSWDPERFLSDRRHHAHRRGSSMDRNIGAASSPATARRGGHARVTSLGAGFGSSSTAAAATGHGSSGKLVRSHDTDVDPGQAFAGAAQTGQEASPSIDMSAATIDDPWREHLPGDGCEPLGSPALPLEGHGGSGGAGTLGTDDLRRSLPKLSIPQWQTGFAQTQRQGGADAAKTSKSARKTPSIPSIKISAGDGEDGPDRQPTSTLPGEVRLRPHRGVSEQIVYRLRVVLRALFPAFRHVRDKSWIGLAISIITAPAIMTLNLTLPVVDDEADDDGDDEKRNGDAEGGLLRLEGSEVDLLARSPLERYRDDRPHQGQDEDDEAFEERIINLRPQSPDGSVRSAEERVEQAERTMRAEHGQRDLDIASALRRLPENGGSPLSFGSGPKSAAVPFPSTRPQPGAAAGAAAVNSEGHDARGGGDDDDCLPCEEHEAEVQELRRSSRRFLALAQCIFAPSFVVWAIVSSAGGDHAAVKVAFAAVAGLAVCALALVALRQKDAGKVRYRERTVALVGLLRCSMGFLVSVMWIMTIVDEVVSILQTVGLIVGISDAILGLTVFAVGNSLGDLVANVTIARLGHPVMAISACFAGPLLNLLLGIGISGTWLLSGESSKQPWSHADLDGIYLIDFSPTLLVSGLGLLMILVGTLVAVPMNGFYLTRPLGVALMATYALIMTLNVLTELFWVEPSSLAR